MSMETEKMKRGEWYRSDDPELVERRAVLLKLQTQLNQETDSERILALVKQMFGHVGENLFFAPPFYTEYGDKIFVGDNTLINRNCTFLDGGEIHIGNRVMIAPDVKIYTVDHPQSIEDRVVMEDGKPLFITRAQNVEIGDGAWICGNVTIRPGVKIGKNAIIGAGSVVVHDIPDDVMAAGNPCKVIRKNP